MRGDRLTAAKYGHRGIRISRNRSLESADSKSCQFGFK